jgi:hypothetical protein
MLAPDVAGARVRKPVSNILLAGMLALSVAGSSAFASTVQSKATPAPPAWNDYWDAHGVNPPPPRNFLEGSFDGTIQNLTGGRLSDAKVRKWVLADLRRGRGDQWGGYQLRLDIVNAGVFGPPGLNGTDQYIERELARGVKRIEPEGGVDVVTAAVVFVPETLRANNPDAGFTEYVIVLVYRATAKGGTRVFRDGHSEPIPAPENPRELRWQLDTGAFVADPTVGPLWYQLRGWSCAPNDGSATGSLCGLVKP